MLHHYQPGRRGAPLQARKACCDTTSLEGVLRHYQLGRCAAPLPAQKACCDTTNPEGVLRHYQPGRRAAPLPARKACLATVSLEGVLRHSQPGRRVSPKHSDILARHSLQFIYILPLSGRWLELVSRPHCIPRYYTSHHSLLIQNCH